MKKVFISFCLFLLALNISFAATKEITIQMAAKMVYGKTNEETKILQQTLYDFGYYKNTESEPAFSGKFDKELKLAVIDFQKTNELKATGSVDPQTVKTLNDFLKYAASEEEEKNQYLDSDNAVDSYDNGIDKYDEGMNYKSDFLDYYKNIPFIKDVAEIISPKKSIDQNTLHLIDPTNKYPEDKYYYFEGDFNFIDCLADKRCIDLEEIYEDK